MLENQLDSIKKNFVNYLASLGLSAKSLKNYKSDLSHFTGWAVLKIRSFGSYVDNLTEAIPFFSRKMAEEYKNYMMENSISSKTINRRLSTARHLSKFLINTEALDIDFMDGIENISFSKKIKSAVHPILNDFRSYLEREKVSANTVKNYLSDTRQFLHWLEQQSKSK